MLSRHSRWLIATLVAVGVLMLGGLVWASPPASAPGAPPMAGNADTVDGFHAASSTAGAAARANKLLAARSNGRFPMGVLPTGQLDTRYVNDDRAETISAAAAGPLLTVHNTGAGDGLRVPGSGGDALSVSSAGQAGLYVASAGQDGVYVNSAGWSGVYVASSGYDAIRVQTAGQDGLRFFEGVGRDYIRAGSDADLDFRVTGNGTAYADGGWQGAADFAELMSAEDDVAAYEAGDVLVISAELDRTVALSSEAYSTMVVGIYSEKPGFVGSPHHMEGQRDDEIAVAVVGIVPCKVSAENGAIRRGDLLVTSSTPGHAMRADNAAPGTILGKALEPLEEGTGVILVLVTLQ